MNKQPPDVEVHLIDINVSVSYQVAVLLIC